MRLARRISASSPRSATNSGLELRRVVMVFAACTARSGRAECNPPRIAARNFSGTMPYCTE